MDERRIYVASSWRNAFQGTVVKALRDVGHTVYDFKEPQEGMSGFGWGMIDENYKDWTLAEYKEALMHPLAQEGYDSDKNAMDEADTCVLVLPCGASAHAEAGYMAGQGKEVYVLGDASIPVDNPELMYKMFTDIFGTLHELITPAESIWS